MAVQETRIMSVSAPATPLAKAMDVDEFMAFVETRPDEERWELIDGVPMMMAPPSPAHQRIAQNFAALLNNAFAAQGRDLFAYLGTGARTPRARDFFVIPDVMVVPGVSGYDLYVENYQLAAEVLSPSNTRREMASKLRRYRQVPDNLYAAFIDAREFLVELHARRNDWQPAIFTQPDEQIELPEFGMRCRVAELYRGTPLDPQRPAQ
jgi:Uma2 family endonuclease